MSEQTITARIELRYNPVIFDVTGFDAAKKRASEWLELRRYGWSDRDILRTAIDSTICAKVDNVRIASLKAIIEDRKVVMCVVVDVTYIRQHMAPWQFSEEEIPSLKDPIMFTNEALTALDDSFAIKAFDIKAFRVKFFI